jgi:hypothetical protein
MQMLKPSRRQSIYPGVYHDIARNRWRVRIRREGKRSWSKSFAFTDAGELKGALVYASKMLELKERQNEV